MYIYGQRWEMEQKRVRCKEGRGIMMIGILVFQLSLFVPTPAAVKKVS